MAEDLDIAGDWKHAWENYTRGLEMSRIRLNYMSDTLVWEHNRNVSPTSAKNVYDFIVQSSHPPQGNSLHDFIWSGALPNKISCFIWLVLENKILTWDNLQRRGWTGPGMCALCKSKDECTRHMFSMCTV